MTRGALVSTVNSSGGAFAAPVAWRMLSQPISENPTARMAATCPARSKEFRVVMQLPALPAPYAFRLRTDEGVQEKHYYAHRDGGIGDIKDIPVVAEGVK